MGVPFSHRTRTFASLYHRAQHRGGSGEHAQWHNRLRAQAPCSVADDLGAWRHPTPHICARTRSPFGRVEGDRYGIDLSYAGTTRFTRASRHQCNGMTATFRHELGDMWTVRLGPLARDAMVLVVERYA